MPPAPARVHRRLCRAQGRTLPRLIVNICDRFSKPFMDFPAFYVMVSRVCDFDSLRACARAPHDTHGRPLARAPMLRPTYCSPSVWPLRRLRPTQSSLAKLLELVHEPELAIWDAGYDGDGRWSDELARGARAGAMAAHAAALVGAAKARQHREVWLEEPSLKMTKGVLVKRCEAAGLSTKGLKADLYSRLVGAPSRPQQPSVPPPPPQARAGPVQRASAPPQQQARAGTAATRGAPQEASTSGPARAARAVPVKVPAVSTLERWARGDLTQLCLEEGFATEGSKPVLAQRLHDALRAAAAVRRRAWARAASARGRCRHAGRPPSRRPPSRRPPSRRPPSRRPPSRRRRRPPSGPARHRTGSK